jgi:hypothetical protein
MQPVAATGHRQKPASDRPIGNIRTIGIATLHGAIDVGRSESMI